MKHIFVNQTALRLRLYTGCALDDECVCEIKYKKPDGEVGRFKAGVIDKDKGIIVYDVIAKDEIDISGNWFFWAYVTFKDGRSAAGTKVCVYVYKEEL